MSNKKDKAELNIVKSIFPYWASIVICISGGCFLMGDIRAVYSIILGGLFSLFALRQLSEDQYHILINGQRRRIFFSFIFRLITLAIPIIIALKYPIYFKFWVILLFLFSSQLIFIVRELILNYNQYKKRINKDG